MRYPVLSSDFADDGGLQLVLHAPMIPSDHDGGEVMVVK